MDAIVNPSMNKMTHRLGISGSIIKHGGYSIQNDCYKYVKENGLVPKGGCIHTSAGLLTPEYIIHTVIPFWDRNDKRKTRDILQACVLNTLEEAKKLKVESVSIPLLTHIRRGY